MIKVSELKFMENVLFRSNLKYNKSSIYPFIEKTFSEKKLFETESLELVEKLRDDAKTDSHAHNVLLSHDMSVLRKGISGKDLTFDDEFWQSKTGEIRKKITAHLGLEFKPREIIFCDEFSKEFATYEQRGASTITVFEGNEKAGIYYLNKRVDKTSTAIHIIHEQIHTCLSQNKDKDQVFMEWFEEGVTIFYSLLIYAELTNDFETLHAYKQRSYIFSKTKPEWDFSKRYFEYMKIFSRVFLSGGTELLSDLLGKYLAKDRKHINTYLEKIQSNTLPISYIPQNEAEQFLATFSSVVEPEKITPLEFVIVEALSVPKTIADLSVEINAPEDVTKNSLGQLFGKGICIMVKDNKIDVIWRKKDLFDQQLIKPTFPFMGGGD